MAGGGQAEGLPAKAWILITASTHMNIHTPIKLFTYCKRGAGAFVVPQSVTVTTGYQRQKDNVRLMLDVRWSNALQAENY